MGNPLGVCETMYKVKNSEKVLWGEIWLASQNVTTRMSLLYPIQVSDSKEPVNSGIS